MEHWQQQDHARSQLAFIAGALPSHGLNGVLDIGAGFGEFLNEVRSCGGNDLCAVEISDDSAKKLKKKALL